jgi:hypothetical protein
MDFIERIAQWNEDSNENVENIRWTRERVDEIEKKIDALCSYLLPKSGAGSLETYLSALPPEREYEDDP